MSKSTLDWENWLYVILYFAFLGGLLYVTKFITSLPYILLIITTLLSYLIYKGKLRSLPKQDASSFIAMLLLVIVISTVAFISKPYRYNNFIGQHVVPGKMVTKVVTVLADEGPNSWVERRRYWQPENKSGKILMDIIGWVNFGMFIGCFVLCVALYSKLKEKEDNLKKKRRYSSGFP